MNEKIKKDLTILSFGAGQDSTALLYMYVYDSFFRSKYAADDFMVVCSDTGDEHSETYRHIEEIKIFCKNHSVEFFHLTPDMGYHSKSWQSLRGFYKLKKTVGSKAFPKTCTDKLKLRPIYKFLDDWIGKKYKVGFGRKKAFYEFTKNNNKIKMMIGIAYGEEKRLMDPEKITEKWKRTTVENIYPLIDLKMDRKKCQEYIVKQGHEVPIPSNCILCPFISEIELIWLYKNQFSDYQDWVGIEQRKIENNLHMRDKNLGVWGKKRLPEILESALYKYRHMSTEQLNNYKMSHGHCVISKY